MSRSTWRSNVAAGGWVVALILAAVIYAEWNANRFVFSHFKAAYEGEQAQGERNSSKALGAPIKDQPPADKYQADCKKSQDRYDECLLQLRATEAAEVQAEAAVVQARYTWWGLWLLAATLFFTALAALAAACSARVAEKALVDLERPHVYADVFEPGMHVIAGPRGGQITLIGQFRYRFQNYGRTPAQLLDITLRYPPVPVGQMPEPLPRRGSPDRNLPSGVIVAEGAPYIESENLMAEYGFGSDVFTDGYPLHHRLFFVGRARYRDIFQATYLTGFCFVFDPIGGRWVRFGDDPYNYAEKECA